jgi:predicted GIY-YIG superfamily endonuclease
MKEYYVYILSNKQGALYTGITNNQNAEFISIKTS